MISGSTSANNVSSTSNKKWPICTFRGLKKFPPKISWRRKMGSEMRKWQKMEKKKKKRMNRQKKLPRSLKTSSFRTKSLTQSKRFRKQRRSMTTAPARKNRTNNCRSRLRKRNVITWTWTSFTRRTSSSQTRKQKTSQPNKNCNSSTLGHSTTAGWWNRTKTLRNSYSIPMTTSILLT